jgi:hypothetical protein
MKMDSQDGNEDDFVELTINRRSRLEEVSGGATESVAQYDSDTL